MRRLMTVLVASALGIAMALPAQATATNYFTGVQGDVWTASNVSACVSSEFSNNLSNTHFTEFWDDMNDAVFQWQDTQFNASYQATNNCGNYDAVGDMLLHPGRANFCSHVAPDHPSSLQFQETAPLGGNASAVTQTCDVNNNGSIDWFVIVVDSSLTGATWHWDGSSDPSLGDLDVRGVLTHEFGHAIGWDGGPNGDGHLSGSTYCPHTQAGYNTMCGDGWGSAWQSSSTPGTADRSIEAKDRSETNDAY